MWRSDSHPGVWRAGVAVVAAAMIISGCGAGDDESGGPDIQPVSGSFAELWPLRGSLATDAAVQAEVAAVVDEWQMPDGSAADEVPPMLVWLGEVDGQVLGLVNVLLDDFASSWLLEVTGRAGELSVTGARRAGRIAPLLNDHVLPIRTPGIGVRYVVSAEVRALTVGELYASFDDHGLTDRLALPECQFAQVRAYRGIRDFEITDLGTHIGEPYYPLRGPLLMRDPEMMRDIDMCEAMSASGWLASGRKDQPARIVDGHPVLHYLEVFSRSDLEQTPPSPDGPPGTVLLVAADYLTQSGSFEPAEWLVWSYPEDGSVSDVEPSAEADVAVNEPGLLVLQTQWLQEPVGFTYYLAGERVEAVLRP